jgi:DNA-binding LytR/AlgR family response regulator
MKAVVVEDEFIVADHLSTILTKYGISVLKTTDNIAEAEMQLQFNPDFYLLDIRLINNESGIDLGGKLHQLNIPFIYITANNEIDTIKKAIQTQPAAYITKPFNENDVVAAVELIKMRLQTKLHIEIYGNNGIEKLDETQILFCRADGVYTEIVTENKNYIQRITLKEIEQKLSNNFVRIHRSYLVNKNKITSRKANLVFINHHHLPVSRNFSK